MLCLHLQGIIVVYDITSTQSFTQLIKWIGYVQSVSFVRLLCVFFPLFLSHSSFKFMFSLQHATADVSLMLLGSKSDLDSRREVTHEDAEKVNCWYLEEMCLFVLF
jgi:GTPase SAR1 family protein